jgi:hypothetical protein
MYFGDSIFQVYRHSLINAESTVHVDWDAKPDRALDVRFPDITGQSVPVLMVSRMMDVFWGDLHMTHQSRSSKSGDTFLSTFPHRLNSKDLGRKRRSFLMKQKSDWKRITLLRKNLF